MIDAIQAVNVHRTTVYQYMAKSPIFKASVKKAIEESHERIYREAFRRGIEGFNEPVIYQGQLCGWWVDEHGHECDKDAPGAKFMPLTVKKYSDQILLSLLKAKVKGFKESEQAAPAQVNIQNNFFGLSIQEFEQLPENEMAKLLRGV